MKRARIIFFFALMVFGCLLQALAAQKAPDPDKPQESSGPVAVINVKTVINPSTADFIIESIHRAERENAQCLIIQLDTPGGLLDSTREIVLAFFASRVPIIVYVAPSGARAGSAGVFITMASHIAAMAPGTNIGAAHPVNGSGQDIQGDMRKKVENDAVAQVKSWAQQRGRNVDWVEKAIRQSASITDKEAVEQKVVDISATDLNDLIGKLDGREVDNVGGKTVVLHAKDAKTVTYGMSLKQKIVSTISQPNVAYILLLIGMLGLFLEYVHPGTLVPGIIGGVCVILFFVIQNMPINYVGVALILLSVAFFIAEIFVSSFGLLTIAGIVSFVIGAILLFKTPENVDKMRVDTSVIATAVIVMCGAVLAAGFLVLKTQFAQPVSGKEGLVGQIAEARSAIDPKGSVFFNGEFWTAHSKTPIPEGAQVKVVKVYNMQLEVESLEEGQKDE